MTWRVWVVLVVVLALGFGRLLIEKRPDKAIDVNTAKRIAQSCVASAKSIAANTSVIVVPTKDLNPNSALEFRATSTVQVDVGANGTEPSKDLTVGKESGGFEFELSGGPVIVKIGEDQFYIDATNKPRFGPSPKLTYLITLAGPPQTKTENGRTIAVLPPGTAGKANIGVGLDLTTLQPIAAKPWFNGVKSTLLPVRAIGQQGLSDLSIDMKQGGVRFDEQGFMLDGCAWRTTGDPTMGSPIGIAEIKAAGTGAAVARLAIPSTLIPAWPDDLRNPVFQIELALTSLDGRYKAYGGFTAVPKLFAAAAALLIIGLGMVWLVRLRGTEFSNSMNVKAAKLTRQGRQDDADRAKDTGNKAYFASLFLGADHQPSLSLFQIFFWTLITVWGMTYVYLTTGNLLAMTTSMMGLLGIAGTGSVIARWISPDPKPADEADLDVPSKPYEFWQILSTNGSFDLLKLQLFVFTLSIGVYVIWRIADTAAFPELDANTLLLLGISQGVYIGGKIGGGTALNRAQTLKVDIATKEEARSNLSVKITTDTATANALPTGDEKTKLQTLITENQAKLTELDKVIAAAKTDLAKALKDLGLS
jgi:hypothetical protein